MGELRNTPISNIFGDGYVQEYTTDDGRKFTIENTPVGNVFGGGKEQIAYDDYGNKYLITNSPVSNVFGGGQQKVVEKISSAPIARTETTYHGGGIPYYEYLKTKKGEVDTKALAEEYQARQKSFGYYYLKVIWMCIALSLMVFFLFMGLFTFMNNGFLGMLFFVLAGVSFLLKTKPQIADFCIMGIVGFIVILLFLLKLLA